MKSQKGITLVSLTIYVIVMTIVAGVITTITTYFYHNTALSINDMNPLTEYTKFNSFFSEEVNHSNIKVLEDKSNYIVFDNGVQYTYVSENKAIYKDRIKICSKVKECQFEHKIKNGKDVVTVSITMESLSPKTIDYTLQR